MCITQSDAAQNETNDNTPTPCPTTPAWFSELNERILFMKSKKTDDPNHSWATSQIFQMHYEIREAIGKRLNTQLPNCDIYNYAD